VNGGQPFPSPGPPPPPGCYPPAQQQPSPPTGIPPPGPPPQQLVQKFTCKLGVGIENDREFRVGARVIQIARKIWQDLPAFQAASGKTRLRGRGVGGMYEAEEPLQLCISVLGDQASFDEACLRAEKGIMEIHSEYEAFLSSKNLPVPVPGTLEVCVLDKSVHYVDVNGGNRGGAAPHVADGMGGPGCGSGSLEVPPGGPEARGRRPEGAPEEAEVDRILEERNNARKGGNYRRSDEIREWLRARHVVVMDEKGVKGKCSGNEATRWRYWQP